jgi:hypothetical protein
MGSLLKSVGVVGLALMCAVWLGLSTPAHAQTVVNENFEDGQYSAVKTAMKVPPKILEEQGNKFLRITGSAGDCSSVPKDLCDAGRNRSYLTWTSHYTQMPLRTDANMRQTYSMRARFTTTPGSTGSDGKFWELYVFAPGGETYGQKNGTGPNFVLWRGPVGVRQSTAKGAVEGYAPFDNERQFTFFPLGSVSQGTWHTYKLDAVWSHNPSVGRMDIYIDGQLKRTISGRDIFLGPTSERLPMVRTGHYGDYAHGQLDVDDIKVNPTGVAPAPCPGVG